MSTLSIRAKVLMRDGWKCRYCDIDLIDTPVPRGKPTPKNKATMDHVLPVSKGGIYEEKNLVACCNHCNNLLGDMFETITEKRKYIKERKRYEIKMRKLEREDMLFKGMDNAIQKWEREQVKKERGRSKNFRRSL